MKERNKASYDRVVLRGILFGLTGGCVLLALAACNQIVGITEPTLVEGTGGFGGEGGVSATSSSTGSTSGSGGGVGGGGGGTTSGSSSSSSTSSSGGGMPCTKKPDCPVDDSCTTWSCTGGTCVPTYADMTKVVSGGMDGDCKATVCNGAGQTVESKYDADVPPDDGNPCTSATCNNGLPMVSPVPVGTTCPGGTCNASGVCSLCSNGMMDGDETGVDCGGSACAKCNGAACAAGADCKSGFCADAVCCDVSCTGTCKSCNINGSAGTCSNIPVDGTDSAPACNGNNVCDGAGGCKLKTGQACNNNADCASGQCVLFMGTKVCAA